MKGDNLIGQLRETVLVQWNARTEQERRFLAVGAAVVVLALVYAVFIGPALDGRAALRRTLPDLRQQAAKLQGLAAEASDLAHQSAPQVTPMSQESLTASLAARGLKPESATMTGEYARLQFKGASFASLVTWLDAQRREARILVQEASFTAQGEAGQVDAALTLRQVQGGPQ
jgi:general secretion pathway protein M